jgi:hypothetical protein
MCFYFQSILKRRQLCDVTTQETVCPDFIIMAVRNPMSDISEYLWSRIGPRAPSDQPLLHYTLGCRHIKLYLHKNV